MTDMLFARHGVLEERNTLARADVLPDFVLELQVTADKRQSLPLPPQR